jgi:hypothetical protein
MHSRDMFHCILLVQREPRHGTAGLYNTTSPKTATLAVTPTFIFNVACFASNRVRTRLSGPRMHAAEAAETLSRIRVKEDRLPRMDHPCREYPGPHPIPSHALGSGRDATASTSASILTCTFPGPPTRICANSTGSFATAPGTPGVVQLPEQNQIWADPPACVAA